MLRQLRDYGVVFEQRQARGDFERNMRDPPFCREIGKVGRGEQGKRKSLPVAVSEQRGKMRPYTPGSRSNDQRDADILDFRFWILDYLSSSWLYSALTKEKRATLCA